MKLALIRRQFSATGGAELYLQRLLGALVKAGHEPHLFAESWDAAAEGVTLHRVTLSGSRAEKPMRFANAVKGLVAREKFDCAFSLERTLKQDVYRAGDGVHRVWLERRREFAPWWKRPFIGRGAFHRNMMALEAQTFDSANTRHIIVNSEMVKREILEHFKFPVERIHLVRNGVDVERFRSGKRAETRARFGVKDDEFLLLFVGSGWERKGGTWAVQAWEELTLLMGLAGRDGGNRRFAEFSDIPFRPEQVKFLVVGKDFPPSSGGDLLMNAGLMRDVESAFAAADLLLVLPIYEPSANVVFEALAAGLPVVTSRLNGAGEILTEGVNGSVVTDIRSPDLVARAVAPWLRRTRNPVAVDSGVIDLDRNVRETLAVLELAAREKSA